MIGYSRKIALILYVAKHKKTVSPGILCRSLLYSRGDTAIHNPNQNDGKELFSASLRLASRRESMKEMISQFISHLDDKVLSFLK